MKHYSMCCRKGVGESPACLIHMQTNPLPPPKWCFRLFISLSYLGLFNLPPTVQEKGVLLERKLFLSPSNLVWMSTSPSSSSLSEFKGSKMARVSNNRRKSSRVWKEKFKNTRLSEELRRDTCGSFHVHSPSDFKSLC